MHEGRTGGSGSRGRGISTGPTDAPRYRDLGLSVFEGHDHIECRAFAEHRAVVEPDQVGDAQGVIVLTPRVTAESVARSDDLLAIGRFGVGYDGVDVAACTAADVVVFITVGRDRPLGGRGGARLDARAVAPGARQGRTGPLGGMGRAVAFDGERAPRPHAGHRRARRDRSPPDRPARRVRHESPDGVRPLSRPGAGRGTRGPARRARRAAGRGRFRVDPLPA